MLKDVTHLGGVRGSATRLGRVRRIVRVLIEIIQESLGFSSSRLQPHPRPGLPTERGITGQIARRLGNNSFLCWVQLKQTVGERSVALAGGRDIRFGRTRRLEAGAFIRVVADQNGRVVIALRLV